MSEHTGPQSAYGRALLPLAAPEPALRADAQRNRRRILDAAAQLLATGGVAWLTMDELARRAQVGKGTLYRNFTDKAGIASALLDDRVRDMHARMLQGPPPLGPGAPGVVRLSAFAEAYIRHISANLDLVLLTEESSPRGRFDRAGYPFWRRHVEILVEEDRADVRAEEARLRAEAVMSVLSAAQLEQWLRVEHHDLDELIPRVQAIVIGIAAS
ncbi:DNA-binding transcriptional regulator, AcrR family [Brevibacterium sandarakinum]|uniref:DNA-binding transcriptional regulator, AcrR family n=1 Tax=Brevibacterium sandarakinum TaxID=629680 RepID=A0A1H1SFJ2_BRESA|nr:TetR/AcrR family transcriptional regulator [Brevibacterium sandarakinum]SDS46737.1 DNA-binding transcriptional regulator, AcrR family [Brevibacterium sandarakinum]